MGNGSSKDKKDKRGQGSNTPSKQKPQSTNPSNSTPNPQPPTHPSQPPSSQSQPQSQPPPSTHSTSHSSQPSQSSNSHSRSHSHSSDPAPSQNSRVEVDSKGFSLKKVEELFEKYKDKEGGDEIGPEGIEMLCKDIAVDPEDVLVLVLAWHLNAQRMGFFSKEEFITGLQKLGCDSISKLKGQQAQLRRELTDVHTFKEIYRFAFGFAKERETKIIDLPTADALLALVLGDRYQHTEPLRQYLKEQTTYKSINLDQWMNILEFSRSIKPDLSNYDENSAWPVLLDEYCEWAKKRIDKTPS